MGEHLSPPQYPIESVDNALKALLLFESSPRLRLADVAAHLEVATSTAHRLMAMLQYRRFVVRDPESRLYVPGPALGALAAGAASHLDARALARPYLERLQVRLQETVSLARLEGTSIRYVDSVEGGKAVRVGTRTGLAMPAHCTASGKATLSLLPLSLLTELYPDDTLTSINENSISSRSELFREVDAVRDRGYAKTNQESEEGVVGLAAPLPKLVEGKYALSVAIPVHRASDAAIEAALGLLLQTVTELDSAL